MKVGSAFFEFLGDFTHIDKGIAGLEAKATKSASKVGGLFSSSLGSAFLGPAVVTSIAGLGVTALHMAGDFQQSMTSLVTGAGESEKAIGGVSKAVLAMAGDVGESPKKLADGLYMIESAGFHGKQGIDVLRASAIAAKVGMADMATVSDATTSALNAYKMKGSDATKVTDLLLQTVASGKMHFQDLAGSLGAVLPAASSTGVSLKEVGAAMATMTMQGTPAADAATYLRQTILNLANPTTKAQKEMDALGLSSIDVSKHLGERGLSGTLTVLTDAIARKMGPEGTVLIETMKKAGKTSASLSQEMAKLPPNLQQLAKEFQAGQYNTSEWHKELAKLPAVEAVALRHVASLTTQHQALQQTLGGMHHSEQTFTAALANMVGGTKSMQAALELTGPNMATFETNLAGMDDASKGAGKTMEGWKETQKDFNVQMDRAKDTVGAVALQVGQNLLPPATAAVSTIRDLVNSLMAGKDPADAFGAKFGIVGRAFGLAVDGVRGLIQHGKDLAPLLGAITAGWLAWNVAMIAQKAIAMGTLIAEFVGGLITMVSHAGLATTAQWLLNFAMEANPIGVVVVAIAAMVGVLILAYQHVKPFRDLVNFLWKEIETLWHWIVGGSPGLVPALNDLMGVIRTVMNVALTPMRLEFQLLSAIVGIVWDAFKGFGNWIGSVFTGLLNNVTGPLGAVGNALQALNPFAKHSPSLVENVIAGTDIIRNRYTALSGLQVRSPALGDIAGVALASAGGGSGGYGQHIAHQEVNVYNPRTELDLVRAQDTLNYLATARARGFSPPPGR